MLSKYKQTSLVVKEDLNIIVIKKSEKSNFPQFVNNKTFCKKRVWLCMLEYSNKKLALFL